MAYLSTHRQRVHRFFTTSNREVLDLVKAWAAISLAFGILLNHGLSLTPHFFTVLITAAFTVGVGFLLHEMGHKIVAQRYGLFAEFRSFDTMLLLAIFFSFFGFIFAAPGAVMIQGRVSREQNGKISLAGPLINVLLALLFFAALQATNLYALRIGLAINAMLALFNLIPFGNFDGKKIFEWNRQVWGTLLVAGAALMYLSVRTGWI
ncbi:MAG: metalloprotease [Candidatus Woesearchaeota archaeon]|nr:metalloprotease [Candidatus Woesearchaeota archaeon]